MVWGSYTLRTVCRISLCPNYKRNSSAQNGIGHHLITFISFQNCMTFLLNIQVLNDTRVSKLWVFVFRWTAPLNSTLLVVCKISLTKTSSWQHHHLSVILLVRKQQLKHQQVLAPEIIISVMFCVISLVLVCLSTLATLFDEITESIITSTFQMIVTNLKNTLSLHPHVNGVPD